MKVCGIIAEYNPFHNGHLYHLQESVRLSEADYTVVVMSGNFVQRGTPAIVDKYTRTQTALACGADLVIELPSYYATGSAEYFATGAVSLLDKLGVVTHFCFGSECDDMALLSKVSRIIIEESPAYQERLQAQLKSGASYPSARAAAILQTAPELNESMEALNSPNNILGIEYMKSLLKQHSSILPLTLKRQGADYHDTQLTDRFSSATALRQAMQNNPDLSQLQSQIPTAAYSILNDYLQTNRPLYLNDFSSLLHYKLLSECSEGFTCYADVSGDLSDRICNNIYRFTSFENFCDLLKTKELTYSRICRCLLHILLNIKKAELTTYMQELSITPYARVLGFKKSAAALFREIDKHTQIPLVTKLADACKQLDGASLAMLKKEIAINNIYSSVRAAKSGIPMQNEYSTPIVIV